MNKKRIHLRCTECNKKFLASRAYALKVLVNPICPICIAPLGTSAQMILIESKEHEVLLKLYHALYSEALEPSQRAKDITHTALSQCNTFFSGEI